MERDMKVGRFVLDVVKCSIFATLLSLIFILIVSVVAQFVEIGDTVLTVLNIVVRIISIFAGIAMGLSEKKSGALKGILCGIIYSLLTYVVFGLVNNDFSVTAAMGIDIAASVVAGAASGILAVNLFKGKN